MNWNEYIGYIHIHQLNRKTFTFDLHWQEATRFVLQVMAHLPKGFANQNFKYSQSDFVRYNGDTVIDLIDVSCVIFVNNDKHSLDFDLLWISYCAKMLISIDSIEKHSFSTINWLKKIDNFSATQIFLPNLISKPIQNYRQC